MGQHLRVVGDKAQCMPCESGQFSNSVGNEPCSSCSSHWGDRLRTAGPIEAASPDECACQEGGLELIEKDGVTACRCPAGTVRIESDNRCERCKYGEYSDVGWIANCEPCGVPWGGDQPQPNPGMSCPGGVLNGTKRGWFATREIGTWNANVTQTWACPKEELCLGGPTSVCREGHTGPLCDGSCEPGWFKYAGSRTPDQEIISYSRMPVLGQARVRPVHGVRG
jgi:hypothetical protein